MCNKKGRTIKFKKHHILEALKTTLRLTSSEIQSIPNPAFKNSLSAEKNIGLRKRFFVKTLCRMSTYNVIHNTVLEAGS